MKKVTRTLRLVSAISGLSLCIGVQAAPWSPEVLVRFSGQAGETQGRWSYAPPVLAADGLLTGVALGGGELYNSSLNHEEGILYRLNPDGSGYTATVLAQDLGHVFSTLAENSEGVLLTGAQYTIPGGIASHGRLLTFTGASAAMDAWPQDFPLTTGNVRPGGQVAVDDADNLYFAGGTIAANCSEANREHANTLLRRTPQGELSVAVRFCDFLQEAGTDSRGRPLYLQSKGSRPVALLWSEQDQALYGITQMSSTVAHPDLPEDDNNGRPAGTLFRIAGTALGQGLITDPDQIDILHVFRESEGGPMQAATVVVSDSRHSPLLEDGDWLYGTGYANSAESGGTVWRINKQEPGSFAIVHAFRGDTSLDNTEQGDGAMPFGPMVLAADGNLYGTASRDASVMSSGNALGAGVLFRVRTGSDADRADDAYEVLHHFDVVTDGGRPAGLSAGPIEGDVQWLYGVTRHGGLPGDVLGNTGSSSTGHGTLFRVAVPLPPVTATLTAESTLTVGETPWFTWSSDGAASCRLSGSDWAADALPAAGEKVAPDAATAVVEGDNLYTLVCAGADGRESDASTATVRGVAPRSGSSSSGGGGAGFAVLLVAALGLLRKAR